MEKWKWKMWTTCNWKIRATRMWIFGIATVLYLSPSWCLQFLSPPSLFHRCILESSHNGFLEKLFTAFFIIVAACSEIFTGFVIPVCLHSFISWMTLQPHVIIWFDVIQCLWFFLIMIRCDQHFFLIMSWCEYESEQP